ncbi:MAG: CPBP family intramembrane metalloprotease [Oscillospiraceae bacterium]|nr:CPBP family intramembrane metalloprotease [Oscillospiraceae bacterium]
MPSGSDERISSLKQQDKTYNEMYREWSLDKSNDFGFFKRSAEKENTYLAGEGFVGQYPAADETAVLHRTIRLVATVMAIYSLLQFLLMLAFSGYPRPLFGMSICKEGFFIGHGPAPVIMSYAVNAAIRIIPVAYLMVKLKAPLRIMLPTKISNPPLFINSIFFAMLAFGVLYLCLDLQSAILHTVRDWSHILLLDKWQRIPVMILYMLIIPVMSEMIHRGIFLNLFRQYGDGFALVLTSLLTAFFSPEGHFLFMFAFSLLTGYFALRTGSLLTAVMMRVIFSVSYYLITISRVLSPDKDLSVIPMAVIIVFIGIGVVATIRFVARYSNRISLPMYNMFLTDSEKIMMVFSNPATMVWIMIYIIYIVMSRFIML